PGGELTLAAVEPALAAAAARDVLAIGPGLGESEEAREAARRIVLGTLCPTVLDADAINAFAGRARELRARRAPTVLTPHAGEMGRLLGTSAQQVLDDRLGALAEAVEATACFVVLKGHQTLIGVPAGRVTVNPTGNPGMASGGMGDALTGMVAAFLGQKLGPEMACRLAVYLHGLAGDLALAAGDELCLSASDLLAALPEACRRLRSL
ncbi:MAG: NAD(P)H-hydrate dehydratase, partial [Thermoanaerobaculia bacterium]